MIHLVCSTVQFDVALLEGVTLDLKGTEDLGISSPVWLSLLVHVLDIGGL